MPTAMTLIGTTTVGAGGASAITLSSIPQTYTDLLLLFSVRSTVGNTRESAWVTFNGTSVTNYYMRQVYQTATTRSSEDSSNSNPYIIAIDGATALANTFSNNQLYINNYTSTSSPKTANHEGGAETNAPGNLMTFGGMYWNNNSAITSINIQCDTSFVENTLVSLYGILKGSGGATVS